ncbi:efflux transporter periplasmic adaptor subunit [Alsobacter soli]|uniref:Efflux transporter periplasmic adaptor subunit n=1 Tax=Alsobacter soli TaxID=2109933 RepID=A0A2T1HUT2_9HYPH|nr:efflux RND transporter periplasmic adaptor subunit [Alsobacter soli]PSC05360.1 efflux transporter periplasmic adaptor subunit [Alsobacter soli]
MRKLIVTLGAGGAIAAVVLLSPPVRDRLGLGAPAATQATAAPAPMAMPAPVASVVKKTLPVYLDYAARTEAVRSVALQAKVSGYVLEQHVADGADVKAGDLLYRIDPRDFEAALEQAKAQLQRDQASLDYLKSSLDRGEELARRGFLAKDNFDQRTSSVRQAEAALDIDRAAIRTAELNLERASIRAPFAGRLGRDQAPVGTLINAGGGPLNTLVQLNPIYVTFNPSETDLAAIQKAQARGADLEAEVSVPGQEGSAHQGRLTFLDNTVDRLTGAITARATIANDDQSLLPGQYVRIRLRVGEQPDALLVPQAAVGSSQLGKHLYIVGEGSRVEQRPVVLGQTDGELVSVTRGVAEGERVVVGNLQKLGPGALVQPLPTKTAAASP